LWVGSGFADQQLPLKLIIKYLIIAGVPADILPPKNVLFASNLRVIETIYEERRC